MGSKIEVVPVETDVLVIGGGLAGCMAAIKASEHGVKVTIADKCNTENSGCAGTGVDHIWAYIPPVHGEMGYTIEDLMEDHVQGIAGGLVDKSLLELVATTSYDTVMQLEKFGVKIRYEDSILPGRFRVVPQFHSVPSSFNFDGVDVKLKQTREARRRGVQIVNRVMVTDLLESDGHIAGALGIGVRDGKIYFLRAKAVVLSTGRALRLTRAVTGVWGSHRLPVDSTGDGKAMAFRAGLGVVNMEFLSNGGYSIGNFEISLGSPRNTTQPAGSVTGSNGEVFIPRTYFYDWTTLGKVKVDAAAIRRAWIEQRERPMFPQLRSQGQGPFFLDLTQGTEEEIRYAEWSIKHEGKGFHFLHYLAQEGFDFRNDKLEFMPTCRELASTAAAGVVVDKGLETQLKGLYAAGDDAGGLPWSAAAGAFAMGWRAGDVAGEYAAKGSALAPVKDEQLDPLKELCSSMLDRKIGFHWRELELAVQNVVDYYCGEVRAASYLTRGLERLNELKEETPLKAETPHELGRCFEVRSVMENAALTMRGSLAREESRRFPFGFVRAEFPQQDNEKFLALLAQRRVRDGQVEVTKIPIK